MHFCSADLPNCDGSNGRLISGNTHCCVPAKVPGYGVSPDDQVPCTFAARICRIVMDLTDC